MTLSFKLYLALLITTAFAGMGRAEDSTISVCNQNTDRAIFAAYLKQAGAGAGWQSQGWFKVASGQCTSVDIGIYTGNVYVYAEDEFGVTNWGEGTQQFCVNKTNAFVIANADIAACTDSTLKKVNSDLLAVKPGTTVWNVSPNFSQINFCNQNTVDVFAGFARPNNGNLESKGWYDIPANKCLLVTVGKYTGPVDYYAEYNLGQMTWSGTPYQFCVNRNNAFDIQNADQANLCTDPTLKMVAARQTTVPVGTTTVNFEAITQTTTVHACNATTSETMNMSYAVANAGLFQSNGWTTIAAQTCADINLGSYIGTVYLYAEYNLGQSYWGSGPFNFCVNRTQNFTIADSANAASCSSNTSLKMVPAYSFAVTPGTNTFTFNP